MEGLVYCNGDLPLQLTPWKSLHRVYLRDVPQVVPDATKLTIQLILHHFWREMIIIAMCNSTDTTKSLKSVKKFRWHHNLFFLSWVFSKYFFVGKSNIKLHENVSKPPVLFRNYKVPNFQNSSRVKIIHFV